MNKAKFRTVAAIAIFSSLAVATPANASALCESDTFSGWFARTFGYCRGSM
ncbi:MAG TPA: hypothetical protein VGB04_14990 [Allosphingosinicella sp.]